MSNKGKVVLKELDRKIEIIENMLRNDKRIHIKECYYLEFLINILNRKLEIEYVNYKLERGYPIFIDKYSTNIERPVYDEWGREYEHTRTEVFTRELKIRSFNVRCLTCDFTCDVFNHKICNESEWIIIDKF